MEKLIPKHKSGIILLFIMIFFRLPSYGQADFGNITGIIVSDSSATPVSFASVALLSTDSAVISGVISNEQGKFLFNDVPYGKYHIKATFVGYKSILVPDIELSRQNKTVDLKELRMQEDVKTIDAAIIVGQRLKGEEKVDRTVFTLNDDVRKASNSALDALKHIPSVSVDFQKNVTLEGQSNIQFYVDGVLRNKEYVAQIKPDAIDKIELITNPGVRYDADVSGVINIVLKKEARYGVSGSIKIPIPHPQKIVADGKGNIEYGNQKFRVYLGDELHYEQFSGSELITTSIDNVNGNPYYFEKDGKGKNSWQYNYMNYGIDWFLNEKSSLNFIGEWRNWKGVSNNYIIDSKVFTNDELTEFLKTKKNSLDKSDNYYFSLFYQRKFRKEGDDMRAEVYYNHQNGRVRGEYAETYISPSDMVTPLGHLDRLDVTQNMRRNGELKLDFVYTIKGIKNEAGIRTLASLMENDFTKRYTVEEVENTNVDEFEYFESRQTAYYNLSGKIKKLNWQAGLRAEYSWLDINSVSNSDYAVLLPQVSLNHPFSKEQSVKFSYRKQIFRPSVNSLNPFETWTDSLHVRIGNPNLDAAIENRFELTYSRNFKANFISPKLYFRYTDNGIQDNTIVTDKGVTMITQDNVGKNMEYGVGINGAFQILKRWRFNANFSVFNQYFKTDKAVAGHSSEEMLSYRFNASNIVTLPKDYTLFMFANYGSPRISYQREFKRDLLMLVGAEKKFSEKLSVDVMYNPFIRNFMYSKIETTTPGYYETWEGHIDVNQLFCFSVTYNFNKGNKISKINRAVEYERNEGSGGL